MTPLKTAEAIAELAGGYADGVVETNDSINLQFWVGTQAEYDLIGTPDANTFYIIEED